MSVVSTRALPWLDLALLARLAGIHDDAGVLTVIADGRPAAATARREGLDRLGQRPSLTLARDAVEALLDSRPGRTYGLVAPLSSGTLFEFALATPMPAVFEIADTARIVPIARAFDATRPVGIVDVHRDHARILEAGTGGLELAHVSLVPTGESDWAEWKAPAAANPLRSYRSSPQRGRFESRVAANRARTLHELAGSVERIAHRRGWRSLVVAGEPELTRTIDPRGVANARVNRALPEWRSTPDLIEALRDELDDARELAVVTLARAAQARPNGFARGIAATGEALDAGRARTIVVEGRLDDPNAADVVRRALVQRVPVLFGHGELTSLHGAICELHG
jgi:hypothetical protein